MTDLRQRTAWIDVLKGIAIICVVLGHNPVLTQLSPKVFNVIFSFHIPLFFFISGYLFNSNTTGCNLCKRRFNTLIRPYLFTVIVISLVYVLLKNRPSPLWYVFWIFYGNGPNLPKAMLHLWFLPNLFLVTMFVWSLFRYIEFLKASIGGQIFFIAVFLILGGLCIQLFWNLIIPPFITDALPNDSNLFLINGQLDNPAYAKEVISLEKQFIIKGLPWSADIVLTSTAFFMSGYFIRKNVFEKFFHKGKIAAFMLLTFAVLHYLFNDTIDLNLRRYDNIFICTLLAFTGIYVCFYTSYAITETNIKAVNVMKYIGRYSLIIFIFHPIIQTKVYFNILALLPDTPFIIVMLLAFAAGIFIPLLLNWLVLERFEIFRFWYYAKEFK